MEWLRVGERGGARTNTNRERDGGRGGRLTDDRDDQRGGVAAHP